MLYGAIRRQKWRVQETDVLVKVWWRVNAFSPKLWWFTDQRRLRDWLISKVCALENSLQSKADILQWQPIINCRTCNFLQPRMNHILRLKIVTTNNFLVSHRLIFNLAVKFGNFGLLTVIDGAHLSQPIPLLLYGKYQPTNRSPLEYFRSASQELRLLCRKGIAEAKEKRYFIFISQDSSDLP